MSNKSPKFKQSIGFDTGKLLVAHIKKNRIYKSALARAINRKPKTVYQLLKQPSVQSAILWEICVALKHNFFADIAAQLGIDNGLENPLQARITQLEKEKSDLELQVKTLKEAIELMGRK